MAKFKVESAREKVMAQIRENTAKATNRAAIIIQTTIKRELRKSGSGKFGPPSPAGQPPGAQTGALARSIQIVPATPQKLSALVGTNLIYARIQEFGGTIRAKTKPWLVFQVAKGVWRRMKRVILPARPYMRPGVRKAREKSFEQFKGIVTGVKGL